MRAALIAVTVGAVSLIVISGKVRPPLIVWNATPSVPIGFYVIKRRQPQRGELALIQLSPKHVELTHRRGYLTATTYLIKPVAALEGDRVCRLGNAVLVRQRVVAVARATDSAGRHLPTWTGCRVLSHGELLVLAPAMDSLDGRYLGPIGGDRIAGVAERVSVGIGAQLP